MPGMQKHDGSSQRFFKALMAAFLFYSTMVVPAYSKNPSEPIKIGFLGSSSGAAAPIGDDMAKGFQLYMEQIHNKMAGREVQVIVENDESTAARALEKTRKLADQDHVDVINGVLLGNIGYTVAPIAAKDRIPMAITICGSDDLTQRKGSDWVLRTSFSSSQSTQPFGEWVYKTLGYKRVAVLGLDYSFGWETVGGFQKSFEEAGGRVVQKVWAPLGFNDFTSFLKQIHKDVDAVFIATAGNAAEIIPKQYKEVGLNLPIIGIGNSFDEAILRHLGDESVGAVTALTYSSALDTPANKKFVKEYKAKYGVEPSFYSEGGYVSGMWINKAVESLHGDVSDKQKFLAALKHVELKDAPRGPIKLDDRGNPIENVYVRRVTKVNGKLENKVIATIKDVSQFWKWNPEEYLKQPSYSREFPPCKYCTATK
jgi:branched-chain amino acid transport system substrate-binding protein